MSLASLLLWKLVVQVAWGASREEVVLIGKVGNFDAQLVTLKTETGPAIVPRSAILNPQDIAPGAIVKAVLPSVSLDKLNPVDEFFGESPPPAPPKPAKPRAQRPTKATRPNSR